MANSESKSVGNVRWELRDEFGNLKASGETHNLITQIGDQVFHERGAGVSGAPAAPTGMKLGTGSTAASKTGPGAALGAYLSNSHQAFDAGFPSSSTVTVGADTKRRITYQATFPGGKATSALVAITEAVIVNEALTNATSTAANTISRVILSPSVPAKGLNDTLTLIWTQDHLGI